jgi:o-succinylbenzoate synthase
MFHMNRLTWREIRLALKEPFRISSGVIHERRVGLLELTERDGATAWSECVAFDRPIYSPETIDTAWMAISEWLAPRLLGKSIEGPHLVHALLADNIRGHSMAKAALEMGCWGLAAEIEQKPLSTLLGGSRERVPTGISLGIQSAPPLLVERAQRAVAAGYRKIKVKIEPGHDIEFVRAVREALGPDIGIMADANSAYTIHHADHLAQLDAFDLIMLEQPLGDDDLVRHAQLQRRLATRICLDESITSLDRAEDMIALGSGRIVNIKPGRVGGLRSSKAIHDLCELAGIPVWCGGMLESGIGRAYNVALASLPNFSLPGDLSPSARYWAHDVVSPEWTMDADGMVVVPTQPGIGVTVDVELIESLTLRKQVLTAGPTMVAVA